MSAVERTYSFRASPDLAERLKLARDDLATLADGGPDVEAWLARELQMALARRLRTVPEIARDQSAFMRSAVELLVGVTEKVAQGLALADEYRAAHSEDQESERFSEGALRASSGTWEE